MEYFKFVFFGMIIVYIMCAFDILVHIWKHIHVQCTILKSKWHNWPMFAGYLLIKIHVITYTQKLYNLAIYKKNGQHITMHMLFSYTKQMRLIMDLNYHISIFKNSCLLLMANGERCLHANLMKLFYVFSS